MLLTFCDFSFLPLCPERCGSILLLRMDPSSSSLPFVKSTDRIDEVESSYRVAVLLFFFFFTLLTPRRTSFFPPPLLFSLLAAKYRSIEFVVQKKTQNPLHFFSPSFPNVNALTGRPIRPLLSPSSLLRGREAEVLPCLIFFLF